VVRVSYHDAAHRASHSPAAQRPPAVQAAVAPLKCLHLITVGQCVATASVVPLIEVQNIKRTALCPTVTRCARLADANSLSLVGYRFEVRAPAIAYHDAVSPRPAQVIRRLPARAGSTDAM